MESRRPYLAISIHLKRFAILAAIWMLLPQQTMASMSFDECSAFNKGDIEKFVAHRKYKNGLVGTVTFTRSGDDLSYFYESTNKKLTNTVRHGVEASPPIELTTKIELSSGENRIEETKVDFGVDLSSVISLQGENIYRFSTLYKSNGGDTKKVNSGEAIVIVDKTTSFEVDGCYINVNRIRIARKLDNRKKTHWSDIYYSPYLKLSLKISSLSDRDGDEDEVFTTIKLEILK